MKITSRTRESESGVIELRALCLGSKGAAVIIDCQVFDLTETLFQLHLANFGNMTKRLLKKERQNKLFEKVGVKLERKKHDGFHPRASDGIDQRVREHRFRNRSATHIAVLPQSANRWNRASE